MLLVFVVPGQCLNESFEFYRLLVIAVVVISRKKATLKFGI